jgi:hypothetical protein
MATSYVDARYTTINNVTGDQMNTIINRKLPTLFFRYLLFSLNIRQNHGQQRLHSTRFLMLNALLGTRTSYA